MLSYFGIRQLGDALKKYLNSPNLLLVIRRKRMERKKLINMVGALLVIILGPLIIILTMDFSKPMTTVSFVVNIIIRFLIIYFAVAIPAHFLTKKYK